MCTHVVGSGWCGVWVVVQAQVSALEQSLLSKTKQRRPLAVYAAASQTVDPAARVRHADAETQTVSLEPDSVVAAPSPRALTMVQAAAVTVDPVDAPAAVLTINAVSTTTTPSAQTASSAVQTDAAPAALPIPPPAADDTVSLAVFEEEQKVGLRRERQVRGALARSARRLLHATCSPLKATSGLRKWALPLIALNPLPRVEFPRFVTFLQLRHVRMRLARALLEVRDFKQMAAGLESVVARLQTSLSGSGAMYQQVRLLVRLLSQLWKLSL